MGAPSTTLKRACPAYSNIVPATPECQRHIKPSKSSGAGAWDVMENIASERRIFFGFASETRTSARDYNGSHAVQQRRSSSSLLRNYLSGDNGFTVLQRFFPREIIMCFTRLNYRSHKWNTCRTPKCSHLGLSPQLYSGGGEGSGICG